MRISTKTMKTQKFAKKSFRSFSEGLRKHQNAAAAAYLAQVKSEKLLADMKGYDSVFDYLLAEKKLIALCLTGRLT